MNIWTIGTPAEPATSFAGVVPGAVPSATVVISSRADAEAASGSTGRVLWFDCAPPCPAEAFAAAVGELAASHRPDLVVGGNGAAARVLLAAIAARLGAPMLTGVAELGCQDGQIHVRRSLLGGLVEQVERSPGPLVVSMASGTPSTAAAAPVPVEAQDAAPFDLVVTTAARAESAPVDLGSARRILAVGRGVKAEADLAMIDELAGALEAEVACSRPLAEGLGWLPKGRYIGVSGQHVAPELYLAAGISGQLQHLMGAADAGTIVAVNTDPEAPIFASCDYGVVADLYDFLPALTRALKG